ncbi:sulfite exporter TauE/SafE family protein [Sulfuriferula sp.]|uniref:sulfite exporter TauE/SafE family protein n=1 Tax=Sulfuriferula sp. TaxID=2025307 RepID=UPI002730DDF3|nr:sulfite exporter TauE/SafE family protein [Sulfuriferula sp.]MDP2027732.1 sulfite exporter TauE/SafE family protein [Sulfuriferula sp.]
MTLIVLYLGLGVFAGLLGGMLGVGGGIVVVPALIWIFKQEGVQPDVLTHLAIGTSLAVIIFTSLSAIRAQQKRGAIDWAVVRLLVPSTLIGGLVSGYLAGFIPAEMLKMIFSIFLLAVSLQLLTKWQPASHWTLPGPKALWGVGLGIGSLSAMMGIGGGTISVPFLHACNVDMKRAIAISSTLGFPIALFGAAGFVLSGWHHTALPAWSFGYVDLPALLAVGATSMIVAPLGVRLAHHLPVARLKRVFGMLLLVVALQMLFSS